MTPPGGTQLGAAVGTLGLDITNFTGNLNIAISLSQQSGKKIAGGLSQAQTAMGTLNRAASALTGGIGGLAAAAGIGGVVALGKMGAELSKTASQAERVGGAFHNLAGSFGANSDAMLAGLQRASHGTISNTELMLDANRAMLLGVARDTDQLAGLMEVARARGAAMGESSAAAFSDIITGIGRLSPQILDNLGIVVDAEKAYADYAKTLGTTSDKLDETQKKQALVKAVITDSQSLISGMTDATGDNAEAWERAEAAAKNAGVEFGKVITPTMIALVNTYTTALQNLNTVLAFSTQQTDVEKTFLDIAARKRMERQLAELNLPSSLGSRTGIGLNMREGFPGGRVSTRVEQLIPPRFTGGPLFGPEGAAGAALEARTAARMGGDLVAIHQAQLDFGEDLLNIDKKSNAALIEENSSYQEQVSQMESSFAEQRADNQAQYEQSRSRQEEAYQQQRSESEAQFQRGLQRQQEDYDRARALEQEAFNNQIDRIRRDANLRDAQAAQELADRQAKQRRDSTERLSELQANYDKETERGLRDHRDRLLSAAGNLDARAVAEEQRRFAEEESDRKQNLDDAKTAEQKRLDQSLAEENEAAQKERAQQQQADALRIGDLQAAFDKQRGLEQAQHDEQLKRQKDDHTDSVNLADQHHVQDMQRQQTDHDDQMRQADIHHQAELNKFAEAHTKRLSQIDTQAADERDARATDFTKQLAALNAANSILLGTQTTHYGDALTLQDEYFKTLLENQRKAQNQLLGQTPGGAVDPNPTWNPELPRPLHYPVDQPWPPPQAEAGATAGAVRASALMQAASFASPRAQAAGRASSVQLNFAAGAFAISVSGAGSAKQLAVDVRNELNTILRGLGKN